MRNKLQTYVKTYEEPEIDENGKLVSNIKSGKHIVKEEQVHNDDNKTADTNHNENEINGGEDDEDLADLKAQMPLGEGVL